MAPLKSCPRYEGKNGETGNGRTGGKVRQVYWKTTIRKRQDQNWADRERTKRIGKTHITAENNLAMGESESVA